MLQSTILKISQKQKQNKKIKFTYLDQTYLLLVTGTNTNIFSIFWEIRSTFTNPHAIPNLYDFLFLICYFAHTMKINVVYSVLDPIDFHCMDENSSSKYLDTEELKVTQDPDSKQCRSRSDPHLARMDFTRARCGLDLGQNYVAVWGTT